ncbi:MAG: autophagy- protein 2 [Watsoniomyces obsoletus]|nr:MAG: autophagy- protein 2 [Watsoniomyces obsoletus]
MASPTNRVKFLRSSINGSLIVLTIGLWFMQVTKLVPDPYLDEVFHIRQAQAYCAGKWHVWDPKITTPPGL